jgi:hypothetical protein
MYLYFTSITDIGKVSHVFEGLIFVPYSQLKRNKMIIDP